MSVFIHFADTTGLTAGSGAFGRAKHLLDGFMYIYLSPTSYVLYKMLSKVFYAAKNLHSQKSEVFLKKGKESHV